MRVRVALMHCRDIRDYHTCLELASLKKSWGKHQFHELRIWIEDGNETRGKEVVLSVLTNNHVATHIKGMGARSDVKSMMSECACR